MIKSTFEESKQEKQTYPYLGIPSDKAYIVLFSAPKTGVVIHISSSNQYLIKLGYYSNNWAEDNFIRAIGKVTLENFIIMAYPDTELTSDSARSYYRYYRCGSSSDEIVKE